MFFLVQVSYIFIFPSVDNVVDTAPSNWRRKKKKAKTKKSGGEETPYQTWYSKMIVGEGNAANDEFRMEKDYNFYRAVKMGKLTISWRN